MVPIGSNTGVRASISKTAREPGEEESKGESQENIQIQEKPQETVSTARRNENKKYNKYGPANQADKPQSSARSNNLELWLSKKKALDQQSVSNKQSSSKRSKKHKPPLIRAGGNNSISEERDNDNVLEELSESSGKDLSYLSKLH